MSNKLFAIFLGGHINRANIEIHDVVFLISQNPSNELNNVRKLWIGNKTKVHIDSMAEVIKVDGYVIDTNQSNNNSQINQHLWFINYGASLSNTLGEHHEYGFVVESTKDLAVKKAKQKFCLGRSGRHLDNIVEISKGISLIPDNSGQIYQEPNVINVYNNYIKL